MNQNSCGNILLMFLTHGPLAKSCLYFLLKSVQNSSDSLLQQVTIQKLLAFISINSSKEKILSN